MGEKQKIMSSDEEVTHEPIEEVQVFYCPISTMPYEFIEFMPKKIQEKCVANIKKNQAKLEKMGMDPSSWGLNLDDKADDGEGEAKSQNVEEKATKPANKWKKLWQRQK